MLSGQTRYNNAIMRRAMGKFIPVILTLLILLNINHQPGKAQAGSAYDLIAGVNALRENQGLEPYEIDDFLMTFAQSHSDYMASLGYWTHTRADGTTAFDHGVKENVAMGTNMSINYCIYTAWSDWTHWSTMVSYASGKVGAGVAEKDGTVYYTLNVLPGESEYAESGTSDLSNETGYTAIQVVQETPQTYSPIIISTPDEDGIIIHTVAYGETLWTIAEAYDVPIDQILRNSNLSPATEEVFEGQKLIIQTATEPSATPTATQTPDPGTPTPTQPRPTLTPFPTRTPFPTQTPSPPPSIFHRTLSNGKNVGLALILVCGLGLILVIYLGFLKNS